MDTSHLLHPASRGTPRSLRRIADEFARLEPAKAMVGAFGFGLLLNVLPIGAVAGALVRLAVACIRPAIIGLGVVKAFELVHGHSKSNIQTTPSHVRSHELAP